MFWKWDLDCIAMGKDPNDKSTMTAIIIARENLTGWVEAKAIRSPNVQDTAAFFFGQIVVRYGLTMNVTTDGGMEFMGMFKQQLRKFGINHIIKTSAHNPAANGVVKRGDRPIKEAIFKRSPEGQTPMVGVLGLCLMGR